MCASVRGSETGCVSSSSAMSGVMVEITMFEGNSRGSCGAGSLTTTGPVYEDEAIKIG